MSRNWNWQKSINLLNLLSENERLRDVARRMLQRSIVKFLIQEDPLQDMMTRSLTVASYSSAYLVQTVSKIDLYIANLQLLQYLYGYAAKTTYVYKTLLKRKGLFNVDTIASISSYYM